MGFRIFFIVLLLLCGLSFVYMNFDSTSHFRNTLLPAFFALSFAACLITTIFWIVWHVQEWRGASFRDGSRYDGGASTGNSFDLGDSGGSGGDCGGGD